MDFEAGVRRGQDRVEARSEFTRFSNDYTRPHKRINNKRKSIDERMSPALLRKTGRSEPGDYRKGASSHCYHSSLSLPRYFYYFTIAYIML